MKRYVLREPIEIHGFDFWGRRVSVRLEPTGKPGWFWRVDGIDMPVDKRLVANKRNRITLVFGRRRLHVFEHLGALRFSGLDGIRIVTSDSWLPYDGCADMYWKACSPHMEQAGELTPYAVRSPSSVAMFEPFQRSVTLSPMPAYCLSVAIHIDYPGIGPHGESFSFPGTRFAAVARVKTQGYPASRIHLAELLSLFGWPHRDNVIWPSEHDSRLVKRLFARHRALDVLGALSVLCPPGGILVGTYASWCAGHGQDVELVRKTEVYKVAPGPMHINILA